jgi:ribonuclease HI
MSLCIEVWVDGACFTNGRPGIMGYAAVGVCRNRVRPFHAWEAADYATNNRAELLGIGLGLEKIRKEERPKAIVHLYSDSLWAVNSLNGIYQSTTHTDLLDRIRQLRRSFGEVHFHWVRGHAGNPHNERAHVLAQEAALRGAKEFRQQNGGA